jgi:uracil-DNA glycosylase
MPETTGRSALNYFPDEIDYPSLREAASGCRGCDLYLNATQTVFGEGSAENPEIFFVGEQPGDQEDLEGHPFVGPAGKLFNRALEHAGIDRSRCYVTNTVKHFKWKPQGKRRLHEKPNAREINACTPWLAAELEVVRPKVLVCLGATAAQALLGKDFRVTRDRGKWLVSPMAERVFATIHPSAILRMPDRATQDAEFTAFVDDLKMVAKAVS